MRVLYCWDIIEHLAARQIESMLKADKNLFFIIVAKSVSDDYEVQKVLKNSRIKLYTPFKTSNKKLNGLIYLLMHFWILLIKRFDLIDVKMAQSREMKNIFLLNKLFNKKYILNMLGKERHIEDNSFFCEKEKKSIIDHIKGAQKIVCVDQTLVNLALKYRNDKNNIIKLWNSQDIIDISDIDKNEIKRKYKIENKKVILFNHRLLKSKRPFLFFEFVEKILKKRNDIVIIVVSTVKEKDVAVKMIEIDAKYQNVLWLGKEKRLNFKELKELFAISDVGINLATLVVPSLATLEAMATGVPQIISDEIDSEAYVVNDYNGLILNELSSEEILEKVEKILDDVLLRENMSKKCIRQVEKSFSQIKWANKMIEVYDV